ncbi:MAG: glycosyltransferase family 39 protein [Candidatus Acidiferrales bacterium]
MIDNNKPVQIERWIERNSGWLALAIVAAAFGVRIFYASACYLNPDEATHFAAARPSTWFGAYQASLRLWHPPLFILVLHAFLYLGRSELILRLPSVIAGTAALWFAFAWMRRVLGEIPALAGLGFMSLFSAAISASTEVRQYGLLLLFVCAALYATERAFADRSLTWAICQGVLLAGALLTHYTAVVVLASVGLYALIRSLVDSMPRRLLWTFIAIQFVLAGILGWLYFAQIRRWIPVDAVGTSYLSPYFYNAGHETLLAYTGRAFTGTFAYASGARHLALPFLLAFLAGIAALLTERFKAPRLLPLLLLTPFVLGFAAGVAKVFPFTGTRHEAYLLPFLVAGIAAALMWLPRRQAALVLLVVAVVGSPLWLIRATPDNNPRLMPKSDMTAAIKYMRRAIPRGSLVFVDYGTRDVLGYYLARKDKSLDTWRSKTPAEEQLGDYRIVVPRIRASNFRPDQVLEPVAESARTLRVPPGDPLWIVSVPWVWSPPLASELPAVKVGNVKSKQFGRISVMKVSGWDAAK